MLLPTPSAWDIRNRLNEAALIADKRIDFQVFPARETHRAQSNTRRRIDTTPLHRQRRRSHVDALRRQAATWARPVSLLCQQLLDVTHDFHDALFFFQD